MAINLEIVVWNANGLATRGLKLTIVTLTYYRYQKPITQIVIFLRIPNYIIYNAQNSEQSENHTEEVQ